MDSLTQIILGAAVGEATLGKKIGNKAMLYGAIAATIPDFDVFASHFTDTVTALEIHRGFTHSFIFSLLFAPICAWIVTRYEKYKSFKGWTWLFFLAFVTHPLLDAHTTWGTQLFWPLDTRLAYKTIFVIDPLYTVPFLIFVVLAMFQKKGSTKRRRFNSLGLIISSSYLLLTVFLKVMALQKFENALELQNISYKEIDIRPAPLNTILWSANIDTGDAYLLANYSFFDSKPITFQTYEKKHHLLGSLTSDEKVQRMIKISKGWFTIMKEDDQLLFNDLRFGPLSLEDGAQNFVFQYQIQMEPDGTVNFKEQEKNPRDGKQLMLDLWTRLKGN